MELQLLPTLSVNSGDFLEKHLKVVKFIEDKRN